MCNDIVRRFEQGPTQYGITAIALHTRGTTLPHVHVLHDCSWSNGTCRSVIFTGFVRRPNRSSIWSANASVSDLYNLVQYLNSGPRQLEYLNVGESDWGREIRDEVWDNSKVLDTSPAEFWKYCTRNFCIQLHATPMAVRRVVKTLTKYAQESVQSAENVHKQRRKDPSMAGYAKTPHRR
ncbi:hypothetical protein HPB51_006014 [Rhipicephalus microplus]|uniref:Uncharacterized protein n=1 Tax=Rhipicephalus microplus TaxID=6941 RepID=A0A9J6EGB9_RHIMP|nr:hypothetical protein HPB51_006014 [Rhipicephalus microplus]